MAAGLRMPSRSARREAWLRWHTGSRHWVGGPAVEAREVCGRHPVVRGSSYVLEERNSSSHWLRVLQFTANLTYSRGPPFNLLIVYNVLWDFFVRPEKGKAALAFCNSHCSQQVNQCACLPRFMTETQ